MSTGDELKALAMAEVALKESGVYVLPPRSPYTARGLTLILKIRYPTAHLTCAINLAGQHIIKADDQRTRELFKVIEQRK